MIREDCFVLSHRPYAVDLSSLSITTHEAEREGWNTTHHGRLSAVWYRRRKGVTVACIGTLWDIQLTVPADGLAFLAAHDDGRYGGDCEGRWDGVSYWGNVPLSTQKRHLEVLRPMLDAYPSIPAGYSGWWTFRAEGSR